MVPLQDVSAKGKSPRSESTWEETGTSRLTFIWVSSWPRHRKDGEKWGREQHERGSLQKKMKVFLVCPLPVVLFFPSPPPWYRLTVQVGLIGLRSHTHSFTSCRPGLLTGDWSIKASIPWTDEPANGAYTDLFRVRSWFKEGGLPLEHTFEGNSTYIHISMLPSLLPQPRLHTHILFSLPLLLPLFLHPFMR